MKLSEYSGVIIFGVLTIAAFIVGIVTDKTEILLAGYSFLIMTLIAYDTVYVKAIKKEVDQLRKLLKG